MKIEYEAAAYVLNKEFYFSMIKIAELMKVSQPTISRAVKSFEQGLMEKNSIYEDQLIIAKNNLKRIGYEKPKFQL